MLQLGIRNRCGACTSKDGAPSGTSGLGALLSSSAAPPQLISSSHLLTSALLFSLLSPHSPHSSHTPNSYEKLRPPHDREREARRVRLRLCGVGRTEMASASWRPSDLKREAGAVGAGMAGKGADVRRHAASSRPAHGKRKKTPAAAAAPPVAQLAVGNAPAAPIPAAAPGRVLAPFSPAPVPAQAPPTPGNTAPPLAAAAPSSNTAEEELADIMADALGPVGPVDAFALVKALEARGVFAEARDAEMQMGEMHGIAELVD